MATAAGTRWNEQNFCVRGWPELFIFSAVSAGFRLPARPATWTIGGLAQLGMASALATTFTVARAGLTGNPSKTAS
ncbi:MAG TPA: hypothetical protein VGP33_16585 [Chloroflexota bacterium]|jgi:hypothetical protein|nr:hypothetical protein [Chloroflexota bacterium]